MMKQTIAAVALTFTLSACAGTSVDILAGQKLTDGGFRGEGPTATFRVRHKLTDNVICEYEHISHWFAGPPFGSQSEENWLDQASCGITYTFGE